MGVTKSTEAAKAVSRPVGYAAFSCRSATGRATSLYRLGNVFSTHFHFNVVTSMSRTNVYLVCYMRKFMWHVICILVVLSMLECPACYVFNPL